MKKVSKIIAVPAIALLIIFLTTPVATAATEEEINTAIDKGLAWLASVQDPDNGAWHYTDDGTTDLYTDIATTALVVLKFVERAKEKGLDPFSPSYEYASKVIAGYDFIFKHAYIDANGRVYFTSNDTYSTAAAMMAIAASNSPGRVISTGPLTGMTYQESLQGMMNWMGYTQQKGMNHTCDVGGWDYFEDIDDMSPKADQSNTGYATLGIGFASAPPPAGFELEIPDGVLARLNTYIDRVQDPMDGGSWYEPCKPYKWVNILKTGNLLYEMALVGDKLDSTRVQNAISYIKNHWNDEGVQLEAKDNFVYTSLGWKDSFQAMFTMMKGLETLGIETLNVGGSDIDWFDVVSDIIVANQHDNGSFNRINPVIFEGEESTVLRTAWALLTLEKVVPRAAKLSVPVDIKPRSCPNPLNVKDKGVLPVAILGTQDFDVTKVDPSSIRLEGVAPLRSSLEDVTTPFEPFIGKENCFEDCTTEGADGFMDLTLKFDAQAVIATIDEITDRECRVLKLTGNLKEEFGGTAIEGEDLVVIQKKHNKGKCWWFLKRKWWHHVR